MKKLLLAIVLLAQSAVAAPAPETLPDPAQEARARALQKEFRCLVCQGESLDESGAPLAADLRKLIRERIARGDSDAQIEHFLVGRYGDYILLKPPFKPDTYLLWMAPLAVLLIAAGTGAVIVLRARRRAKEEEIA